MQWPTQQPVYCVMSCQWLGGPARAFRKGVVRVATDFELRIEGQLVAEREHPAFEPRMPTDPAPNGTQRDSAPPP